MYRYQKLEWVSRSWYHISSGLSFGQISRTDRLAGVTSVLGTKPMSVDGSFQSVGELNKLLALVLPFTIVHCKTSTKV